MLPQLTRGSRGSHMPRGTQLTGKVCDPNGGVSAFQPCPAQGGQNSLTVARRQLPRTRGHTHTHTHTHTAPRKATTESAPLCAIVLVQEHLGDTPGPVVRSDILRKNKSYRCRARASVVHPAEGRSGSGSSRSLWCCGCCTQEVEAWGSLRYPQQIHPPQQVGDRSSKSRSSASWSPQMLRMTFRFFLSNFAGKILFASRVSG